MASSVSPTLNAFRAIVRGTVTRATPPVPATNSGYFVNEESGRQRPLGEVRHLLLEQLTKSPLLSDAQRLLIATYYGLYLDPLPLMSKGKGSSIADCVWMSEFSDGREELTWTYSRIRTLMSSAVSNLERSWLLRPHSGIHRPRREPDPTKSDWFRQFTHDMPSERRARLVRTAVDDSRGWRSAHFDTRQSNDLDLDWWEYHFEGGPSMWLGKPEQRINQERLYRANASVSISLWDRFTESAEAIQRRQIRPRIAARGQPADGDDKVDRAKEIIDRLGSQLDEGSTNSHPALELARLESFVYPHLNEDYRQRGAAVLARAAGDNPECRSAASTWYQSAIEECRNSQELSEATLSLSVAASARSQFRRSASILSGYDTTVARPTGQSSYYRGIGESAWRVRAVQRALSDRRSFRRATAQQLSVQAVEWALTSLRSFDQRPGPNADPQISERLRAMIRLAEAVGLLLYLPNETVHGGRAADQLFDSIDLLGPSIEAQNRALSIYDQVRWDKVCELASLAWDGSASAEPIGVLKEVRWRESQQSQVK